MIEELLNKFYIKKKLWSLVQLIDQERASLKRDFTDVRVPHQKVKILLSRGLGGIWDVEYRRVGDTITITIHPMFVTRLELNVQHKVICYLYWFSLCEKNVETILVNVSDGERSSLARFAPSTNLSDVNLLPDTHFFMNRGYRDFNKLYDDAHTDWDQRDDKIVWRGSAFGNGYTNFNVELAKHPAILQRIRFAHAVNGSEIDFKFVEHFYSSRELVPISNAGLLGERIPEPSWVHRKYAIDIDGYSNTWSNFFIRLKLGCCVFKVDSDFGFRQWYYDKLVPFVHYIPIKSDLSDLFQQVEWARAHQSECKKIADNGRKFANSMTFATESKIAVKTIEENWKL